MLCYCVVPRRLLLCGASRCDLVARVVRCGLGVRDAVVRARVQRVLYAPSPVPAPSSSPPNRCGPEGVVMGVFVTVGTRGWPQVTLMGSDECLKRHHDPGPLVLR